jgi:hypothetical protein
VTLGLSVDQIDRLPLNLALRAGRESGHGSRTVEVPQRGLGIGDPVAAKWGVARRNLRTNARKVDRDREPVGASAATKAECSRLMNFRRTKNSTPLRLRRRTTRPPGCNLTCSLPIAFG